MGFHRAKLPSEDLQPELFDVPAAVVCVNCGRGDCAGCRSSETDQEFGNSGVIVSVPWERPRNSVWFALWATTRAATQAADSFFSQLPEGSVTNAFSFAVLAEMLAVGSTLVVWFTGGFLAAYLTLPRWLDEVFASPTAFSSLVRTTVAAWVMFCSVLLLARLSHGLTLHYKARKLGASPGWSHALRFGFYAAAWDLATSPIAIALAVLQQGPATAVRHQLLHIRTTPRVGTTSFLRGTYGVDDENANRIKRFALWVTSALALVATLLALVVVAFVAAQLPRQAVDRALCRVTFCFVHRKHVDQHAIGYAQPTRHLSRHVQHQQGIRFGVSAIEGVQVRRPNLQQISWRHRPNRRRTWLHVEQAHVAKPIVASENRNPGVGSLRRALGNFQFSPQHHIHVTPGFPFVKHHLSRLKKQAVQLPREVLQDLLRQRSEQTHPPEVVSGTTRGLKTIRHQDGSSTQICR